MEVIKEIFNNFTASLTVQDVQVFLGKKGYFVMSDEWFNDNVYQLIINKKHLPAEKLEILKQDPILLPVWHPLN